jgi:hypothetical protein
MRCAYCALRAGLDAARRNPGIGDMAEQFSPHFAALHAGYT